MSDTRQQIIQRADELIRRRGFNAFSYTDISGPLDIRNAAVHYYFPSKSDLGAAVIDAELQQVKAYRSGSVDLPGDEQLKLLVCMFYRNNNAHLICLMGSLTPDYDTFDHPLQQKVEQMCRAVREWVTELLESARTAGRLHFAGTAGDRAMLVISSLLSSLLLSRVLGGDVFERMLDQLLRDIGASWRIADLDPRKINTPERNTI